MRLLNTRTRRIAEFLVEDIPPYAILSHTWGQEEISFHDMSDPARPPIHKTGFAKIDKACNVAAEHGHEWIWIDTCCIDKSSSAELTEAINSMYNWYKRAQICFVYLADVDKNGPLDGCRWFTRGWTLQELIAPREMVFFDRNWKEMGTKQGLANDVVRITRICKDILCHRQPLSAVSVAQKMSWASGRKTSRIEDTAYCLLGIFGVHLDLKYGEERRAFRRLQEAILSSVPDLSVFAWKRKRPERCDSENAPRREYCGVFATEPDDFAFSGTLVKKRPFARHELLPLNGAIKTNIQLSIEMVPEGGYRYLLPLDCCYGADPPEPGPPEQGPPANPRPVTLCVRLRKSGYNEFIREDPYSIVQPTRHLPNPIVANPRYLIPDMSEYEWVANHSAITPNTNTDLVGQKRTHAIQLHLPNELRLYILDIWPGYRFDGEDRVFYLTDDNTEHDSCMIRLRGGSRISPHGDSDHINVDFECVFFALGWSSVDEHRPPQCTVVNYSDIASVLSEFRTDACGWDFNRNYVLERLVFHGMPRASGVVIQGRESRVRVSFEVKLARDGNVCAGNFWRVSFRVEDLKDWDGEVDQPGAGLSWVYEVERF
ncbi:vegetative incompatibility protein HET-E-1 [Podospora aff. communis PSN243]|uniref:Vegetative incompatibility protein HET-E-1 n=1 Tax=Podospora aff. communis PSN243 TaxID=3040156 RepID=A0AAV9GLC3_9PEZI|nr:vegetative incompatibility protein HET-E-1 [Podospora aff. communis PSN243]